MRVGISIHADLEFVAKPRRRLVKLLTERRRRRGVFSSVDALIEATELRAEHWNDDPRPCMWRKTAEEIIEKVRRGRAALHRINSAAPH